MDANGREFLWADGATIEGRSEEGKEKFVVAVEAVDLVSRLDAIERAQEEARETAK